MKIDRENWKMFAWYIGEILLFMLSGGYFATNSFAFGWIFLMAGVGVSIYVGRLIQIKTMKRYEKS